MTDAANQLPKDSPSDWKLVLGKRRLMGDNWIMLGSNSWFYIESCGVGSWKTLEDLCLSSHVFTISGSLWVDSLTWSYMVYHFAGFCSTNLGRNKQAVDIKSTVFGAYNIYNIYYVYYVYMYSLGYPMCFIILCKLYNYTCLHWIWGDGTSLLHECRLCSQLSGASVPKAPPIP